MPNGYTHLIPYELSYSNVHSPIAVLSQLHGLTIDEALTAAAKQNEAVPVASELEQPSPAPVVENPPESVTVVQQQPQIPTDELLYQQVFGVQAESSGSSNSVEEGAPPTEVTSVQESSASDIAEPQPQPETTPSVAPPAPTLSTPIAVSIGSEQVLTDVLPTKNIGEVIINAEEGKLHMQASLPSGAEEVKVSIGELPKLEVDAVPVVIPELSVSAISKDPKSPKGPTNVNVNVNVNVNGDGTGSVINSTAVADIIAPLKTGHKKCD